MVDGLAFEVLHTSMPFDFTQKIGIQQNQPINVNLLATHRFRVLIYRTPNIEYFCQEANIPGIAMGNATQPTPLTDIPRPGNKVHFEDFVMTFPVDEDMKNYKELAAWIIGLGFPKSFGQYKDLSSSIVGIRSDIALMILDSNSQPAHTIVYRDAFPVSLSGISFDVKTNDVNVPLATATFKYTLWELDEVDQDSVTITQADR
jgi:hypothetical protein